MGRILNDYFDAVFCLGHGRLARDTEVSPLSIITLAGILLGTFLISVAIVGGGSALIFLNIDAALLWMV